MSKVPAAICLSLSILAVGLAGIALLQTGSDFGSTSSVTSGDNSSAETVREVRKFAATLREEAEELRLRIEKLEGGAAVVSKVGKEAEAPAAEDDTNLAADIAALAERLENLESDESIAELARSGFARARKKDAERALALVLDTSQPARERLKAWQGLRNAGGKGKGKGQGGPAEALQSIMDLARDTALEPELREDAVKSLRGERSEEVKQPMLDLLADDTDPRVRMRSLEVLMWHGGDPAVLETIMTISREDRHEDVQRHATAIMPKVEHFAREAQGQAESQGDSK
jgi:NADH dehydrogenase/NADH:ubiquinone oxidoreductase subunit G